MNRIAHLAVAVATLATTTALAGPGSRIEDVRLEDLMDLDEDVSTRAPMTEREYPGTITIVHREEIQRMAARDLLDVLQRIPGFQAGLDVQGVVALAVRGQWSAEGRVLLLLDGQPMNEPMYGMTPLGGRFDLSQVQRIEIIRGPGASKYGFGATAAAINIVTVMSEGAEGGSVHLTGCMRAMGAGCTLGGVTFVHQRDRVRVGASWLAGQARLFGGRYTDFYGGTFDAQRENKSHKAQGILSVDAGDLHLRLGGEQLSMTHQDGAGLVLDEAIENDFTAFWARAWSDTRINDQWTVQPQLGVSFHRPWHTNDAVPPEADAFYDRQITRADLGVDAVGELGSGVRIELGGGAQVDHLRSGPHWREWPMPSGGRGAAYLNGFAHVDLLWVGTHASLTASMRGEFRGLVGSTFAPRIAVTSTSEHFHAKVQFTRSARVPTYEQLFATWDVSKGAPGLAAERGIGLEGEVGARWRDGISAKATAFGFGSQNPIVFAGYGDGGAETYAHGDAIAHVGGEVEMRVEKRQRFGRTSYAYQRPLAAAAIYAVPGRADRVAALATHTLTTQLAMTPGRAIWVMPTLRIIGGRTAWTGVDEAGELVATELPVAAILDVAVRNEDVITDDVSVELGIHDLLGQDPGWHQPYAGGHAPMPGRGRELRVRVEVSF